MEESPHLPDQGDSLDDEQRVRLAQRMREENDIHAYSEPERLKILARKHAQQRIQEEEQQTLQESYRPQAVEADIFLQQTPPEPDWIVPGVLERQDRLIVTGSPGHGKSTLLRQTAMQLASGLHPFGGENFPPLRVLLFDLENSRRQIHRKLVSLRNTAGENYHNHLYIISRTEGLDLNKGDGIILESEISACQPDVLITGPLYKLAGGDLNDESCARLAAQWLDKIRNKYGTTLILEAHSPHTYDSRKPVMRPAGTALWTRWPEFGIHLAQDGTLTHWRGPREERDWPAQLWRGGEWPWTAPNGSLAALWDQIVAACLRHGTRLSQRDLADMFCVSVLRVAQVCDAHLDEWRQLTKQ
ncbi:AAA family ATPase [Streptomyces sp. NPDC057686]|uniref:AAA family ATPase n=1 Tax=Streptomyces sp. NPDC057686 TaxID=3346212 RepID=UPI0036776CFC